MSTIQQDLDAYGRLRSRHYPLYSKYPTAAGKLHSKIIRRFEELEARWVALRSTHDIPLAEQAARIKDLEAENERLRETVEKMRPDCELMALRRGDCKFFPNSGDDD
jgi:hypothetical protein